MTAPTAAGGIVAGRLEHLPLPLFAAPMGVGGLGLAWREAARVLGAPELIGEVLLGTALASWLLIALLHVMRALNHPGALAGDLRHPIRSAFAGAVSIGLLIVAGGFIPYAPAFAAGLWLVAVGLHLAIGIWTVRGLLTAPREAATLLPPLLIPLVGNIVAPIFGAKLGFPTLSWMLFGLGMLLWAGIQPLILGRIVSGPPLPGKLLPTLAIMLAPPAVGAVALSALTGGFDTGPLALLGLAAFVAAVLLAMAGRFAATPFAVSWWAWTFPSAAFSVAVSGFAHAHAAPGVTVAAWAVLALATAIGLIVGAATLRAAALGELLKPET
ncbi:SLAC1 family transporter [Zavarzinia marina]|uniref:SLAC1 family transporter n=1 Tax=Zavarzinia marina TaxID=2911065 RepID=UPI001F3D2779|nr:C4-dicarboxylate ABC transporter [Zavarzinia marina]